MTNHFVGIEFIEGGIDLDIGSMQTGFTQLADGRFGCVLLTAQVTAQAAVQADTQFAEVTAQHFGLAHTDGRKHIVVVAAEGRLAMSNQVNTAHTLTPAVSNVSRGYGHWLGAVNEKTYACLKLREQMFPRLECGWQGLRGMGMLARYY